MFRFETEPAAITAESLRGRVTVIAFLTTYDLGSQLVAQRLDRAVRGASRKANALGVIMEAPRYAVLVSAFKETLDLAYPVVLADHEVLSGRGPWGDLTIVPVMVVLTASGRIHRRFVGAVGTQELADAIQSAAEAR